MDTQALQFNPVLLWLRFVVRMSLFALALFFPAGIALYTVPGFDVVRYGWSGPSPLWMKIAAFIIHIP